MLHNNSSKIYLYLSAETRTVHWCYPDEDNIVTCSSPYTIQITQAFLGHTDGCADNKRNVNCEVNVLTWLSSKCNGFLHCMVKWEALRCNKITCNDQEYDVNYLYLQYGCPSKHV